MSISMMKGRLSSHRGARYAYSNFGFILLGRIVEEVSGLSYDEYLQQNIFGPADMRSTGHLPESVPLPRRAIAYTGFGSNLHRADETLPFRGTSNEAKLRFEPEDPVLVNQRC